MKHSFHFEFSPKIIVLLGEELIHDHKIAISELVKNAYDADANFVSLTIEDNCIIIEDDGVGMNLYIIENIWLKPGKSTKGKTSLDRTDKYHRYPLGEKGIGRFGIHRLGKTVDLFSKHKDNPEVYFSIDWRPFEEADSLKNIKPIVVVENKVPKIFTGGATGTKMIIKNIRHAFTDKDIDTISSDLQKLLSPFESIDNFKINFFRNNDLLSNKEQLISIKDIKEKAMFSFDVVIKKDKIIDFSYRLHTKDKHKIKPREITIKDLHEQLDFSDWDGSVPDLGNIKFKGYIYEYKLSNTLGLNLDKRIKEYLSENGGIRVYRDSLRVYNYGEEGKDNDIIDLDKKRAKKIGDYIGFNQLLASVELDRKDSVSLKEKTNREGFIHNEEFEYLRLVLNQSLERVNLYRKDDKQQLNNAYLGKEFDRGDISTRVEKIIKYIDNFEGIEKGKKERIIQEIQGFSKEFENIRDIFLTASSTGLNLTFVIHEIDKILDSLESHIHEKNFKNSTIILNHLRDTIKAYKDTIKLDKRSSQRSLQGIIEQAIFNFNYRFLCHKITLIKEIDLDKFIIAKKNLIVGAIMNIFDNSIWWLEHYKIESKSIYIKLYQIENDINLVIADNGKGFNISFESARAAFVSGRLDDSGMGIGLHLVEQIMVAHEGMFSNGDYSEESLPAEFQHGAILKLTFKSVR